MEQFPRVAFIGGGNMANALVNGLIRRGCPLSHIHIIEVVDVLREQWQARGISATAHPDDLLGEHQVWVFAVKPQQMREVVLSVKPFLTSNTLVISIAAGISMHSLAGWLGSASQPWQKIVRCMPNTPALVSAGVTGMTAPKALAKDDRHTAEQLLSAVGDVVWVDDDAAIDAVTALSGSGPAYVFLFLESLIAGGQALGLDAAQSRELALATLSGATKLAAESSEPPSVLRERVTSKGGTTAAALDVFRANAFEKIVQSAMDAASRRAAELSDAFGKD